MRRRDKRRPGVASPVRRLTPLNTTGEPHYQQVRRHQFGTGRTVGFKAYSSKYRTLGIEDGVLDLSATRAQQGNRKRLLPGKDRKRWCVLRDSIGQL